MHTTARRQSLALGALTVIAWGASACSDEGARDAAALGDRPTPTAPATPTGGAGSGSSAPPGAGTPTPSATNTPPEANPTPAGPVTGSPPPAGAGAPAPDPAPAASADADGVVSPLPALACPREQTDANVATVAAAIDELFVQGDIGAVDRYWGEPYLQHNPMVASGVTTFRTLFGGLISPGNSIYALSRIVGECELVLIHGNYSFGSPTFDMFRVADGRIVEHWDALATGAGPNPSGHTALNGPTAVEDVALGAQNEALVLEFVDRVLIGAAYDAVGEYMSPQLIEHDAQSTDGAAAYVQNLQQRALTYRQVHHDIADGNFVFVLSEGAAGNADVAHYDLFRVQAAQIVEHWNGRRDVPPTTQSGLGIF